MNGGRLSMVGSLTVTQVTAGSNPPDHPNFAQVAQW